MPPSPDVLAAFISIFPASVLSATLDAQDGVRSLVRVVDAVPRQIPAPESVERALDVLADAQRPLIILGKGAAYAQADADIRTFIERTGIPFLPMSMAKGLVPDDHLQSAAAARSFALAQADVVMLIGARLNWLLDHGRSPAVVAGGTVRSAGYCADRD